MNALGDQIKSNWPAGTEFEFQIILHQLVSPKGKLKTGSFYNLIWKTIAGPEVQTISSTIKCNDPKTLPLNDEVLKLRIKSTKPWAKEKAWKCKIQPRIIAGEKIKKVAKAEFGLMQFAGLNTKTVQNVALKRTKMVVSCTIRCKIPKLLEQQRIEEQKRASPKQPNQAQPQGQSANLYENSNSSIALKASSEEANRFKMQLKETQGKLTEIMAANKKLVADNVVLRSKVQLGDKISEENIIMRNKVKEMQLRLESQEKHAEEKRDNSNENSLIAQLKEDRKRLHDSKKELMNERDELKDQVEKARLSSQRYKSESMSKDNEVSKMRQQCEKMSLQKVNLIAESKETHQELETLKKAHGDLETEMNDQVRKLNQEIRKLKTEIVTARAEEKQAKADYEMINTQNTHLKTEIDNYRQILYKTRSDMLSSAVNSDMKDISVEEKGVDSKSFEADPMAVSKILGYTIEMETIRKLENELKRMKSNNFELEKLKRSNYDENSRIAMELSLKQGEIDELSIKVKDLERSNREFSKQLSNSSGRKNIWKKSMLAMYSELEGESREMISDLEIANSRQRTLEAELEFQKHQIAFSEQKFKDELIRIKNERVEQQGKKDLKRSSYFDQLADGLSSDSEQVLEKSKPEILLETILAEYTDYVLKPIDQPVKPVAVVEPVVEVKQPEVEPVPEELPQEDHVADVEPVQAEPEPVNENPPDSENQQFVQQEEPQPEPAEIPQQAEVAPAEPQNQQVVEVENNEPAEPAQEPDVDFL